MSAQQPARGAQPKPATPSTPAAKRAAPGTPQRRRRARKRRCRSSVGETLTYDVAWSGLPGGRLGRQPGSMEKRPSYNSTAYYIVAEGRPMPLIARFYALYYKMDSLLDSFTTLSQRSRSTGGRRAQALRDHDLQPGQPPRAVRGAGGAGAVKSEFAVPQNVQDGLATLYALRGRDVQGGRAAVVPVTDDGALYTANFDVGGPEPIKVPLGQVDAWKLRVTILDADQPARRQATSAPGSRPTPAGCP